MRCCLGFTALILAACSPPEPILAPSTPHHAIEADVVPSTEPDVEVIQTPTPAPTVPESEKPVIALPTPPETLTSAGFKLITDFEGWAARAELPDLRYSGVSWAWGYDSHQNSRVNILLDWAALPAPQPVRLAATQPFFGRSAVQPTKDVHDIVIPHFVGDDVFIRVDMARTFDQCRRAMPGFDDLRPNAQSAIASLIFNRGPGMSGVNRTEMRAIRDAVPSKDYEAIAMNFKKMVRIWRGTSIESGMTRRRLAEAALVLTP